MYLSEVLYTSCLPSVLFSCVQIFDGIYYIFNLFTSHSVDATEDNGRMGRLLNHSKTQANVVTKLYEVDEHPYLCLVAAKDIKSGDELQYDYGERSKAAIESHPWLAA